METVDSKIYRNYIILNHKGKALLYVKIKKYVYGLMRSSLMIYLKLVKDLEDFRLKINPYDRCVSNKTINGQQMTVTCHVDDLKVSHKDPFQVTKFSAYLSSVYGKNLTVTRGKVHIYIWACTWTTLNMER